jgi:hypothetical protein
MPSKVIVSLILVAISSLFTSVSIAQRSEQPPTAQEQRQPSGQRPMGPEGTGMGMGPGMVATDEELDEGLDVIEAAISAATERNAVTASNA